MKLRPIVLAIAVLAILSALAYVLQRPPRPAAQDPRVGQPVFSAAALTQTAQIRLGDQGKTVLLAKQADGKWTDSSYYDLPVDFSKLSRLVDDLAAAKIQRLVTRTPDRLTRLGFKEPSVTLFTAGGKALWTLTLGKSAEGGGRFLRFDDEPKGYLASLNAFLDVEPKNWADSLLLELKADDIASVELGFDGGGIVAASRAKKGAAWTAAQAPAGHRINADRVTALLGSLASLRFQDTSDLTDPNAVAARQHGRTLKFTTFDQKTITLQLGRKPEEKIAKPAAPQKPEGSSQASTQNAQPKTQNSAAAPPPPAAASDESAKPKTDAAKPEDQTVPAGPVYAFISSSDPAAPINALMKKRAFQVYEWNFTNLPQKSDELFEPIPPPPAGTKAEAKPGPKPATPKLDAKPTVAPAPEPPPKP